MELRDLYKLLYQGVRGPEHILSSADIFRQRLREEWEALEPAPQDPLYEAICPDGRLLRLNLRPYRAAGGLLEQLSAACLAAGDEKWGTQADLRQTWDEVLRVCRLGAWQGFSWEACQAFTLWLQAHGFPPVHHSEAYRQLYRPAYRLVLAPAG